MSTGPASDNGSPQRLDVAVEGAAEDVGCQRNSHTSEQWVLCLHLQRIAVPHWGLTDLGRRFSAILQ
jgi:hypothetical protein